METTAPPPPSSARAAGRQQPRTVVALILYGLGGGAILGLVWPVFPGLTLAAVLAIMIAGPHRRVRARIPSPGVAAGLSTLLAALGILLPLSGVLFVVGSEAMGAINWLTGHQGGMSGATEGVQGAVARTAVRFGVNPASVVDILQQQARRAGELVAARTLSFLSGIPGVLLQFGVALVTLFYLLRDGDEFLDRFRRVLPLDPAVTDELLQRSRDIAYATVFGNVMVAVVQGIIGGVAFRALGIPAAALWGTTMAVMAMIPMVGPPIVWIPASIYLAVTGHWQKSLVLVAIGALVIGTVDNLIRAIFVGGRARVHSLVVFLSVLGGVLVFGAAGIVVGPVMFVLALIAIDAGRLATRGDRYVGASMPAETAGG